VLEKDELVFIRAHKGQPLIRRIKEFNNKVVFFTDDSRAGIISVGFPIKDVFKYETNLASSMERLYREGQWDWKKLIQVDRP
jgi:hypothetical protein